MKYLVILIFGFFLIFKFSDTSYSYMLDCEDLYDTCIENNPYDKDDNFFAYYGYKNGCSSSRTICLEMVE